MIRVEFFHDVLCGWCYALSPRVRRLVEEHPDVVVEHRCFALAPTPDAIVAIFGSKEAGKAEMRGRSGAHHRQHRPRRSQHAQHLAKRRFAEKTRKPAN